MNEFDRILKQKAKEEEFVVPELVDDRIENTLLSLQEKKDKRGWNVVARVASIAACASLVCIVLLPNCSEVYAKNLEKIPVIGDIVRVVTIRNYFYSDQNHEMDIEVPKVELEQNEAADYINKEVEELTSSLVERFKSDLEEIGDNGHSSVYMNYEILTNTDDWFTLKIKVNEAAGSGNTYYKYYHVDKKKDTIVELKDLFLIEDFSTVLEEEMKRQARLIMSQDSNKVFWIDNVGFGEDFLTLDGNHNFYWNELDELVIVFDKYEIAPGSMGTPEFAISKEVIADILKEEYR